MSVKDYYIDLNKEEMTIEVTSKNLNSIGVWLRTLRNKLKDKNVITVKFCAKVEFYKKQSR